MLSRRLTELVALILASATVLVVMLAMLPNEPMVDEHFHLGQIRFINAEEFVRVPELTTPLGYHYSVALPARLLNVDSLRGLRAISAVLGLIAVLLAWLFLVQNRSGQALVRAVQILFCPLVWPFYFLLYTDLVSLTVVMTGLLLASRGRFGLAALVGIAMLAWRQSNVFWAALFWLMALHQSGFRFPPLQLTSGCVWAWLDDIRGSLIRALPSTWILLLPMLAFAVFVLLNQGVAVGDRQAHQFGASIYPGQVFFMLLVAWMVLLPLHVARLKAISVLIADRPWILALLAVLFVVYMATFTVSHPYNLGLPEFHLRNRLLGWLDDSLLCRALAFVGMAWSLLTLAVTPLQIKAGYWLYPVTLMALLPVELIEQRYYMVPMVFFLLFRKPGKPALEWAVLVWFVVLSTSLTAAIASLRYFL